MAHFRCMAFVCIFLLMAVNVAAFQWTPSTPEDGAVIYACAGADVTLAWRHILQTGDVLASTVWDFQGASDEMVAMMANGNFFATPSYSHRVAFVPNSGIMLSHVSKGDAGNYTVTIAGHDSSGASIDIRRSVMLVVSDGLMTSDHELHVTQQAAPLFSNVTQQFHATLACGHFTYTTKDPPVSVVWQTPEGTSVPSTSYSQGDFLLMIPNPVSGGSYSCRIDAATENKSCSHGQTASITVDATLTRLTLLEAREARKDVIINQLTSEVSQMTSELDQKGALISQLTSTVQTLDHELEVMKNATPVHFHAKLNGDIFLSLGSIMKLTDVISNQGGAYDPNTGYFTAPVDGSYVFMATTGTYTNGQWSNLVIKKEGTVVARTNQYRDSGNDYYMGTCHAALLLKAGQRVWLECSFISSYFQAYITYFTGFRIM